MDQPALAVCRMYDQQATNFSDRGMYAAFENTEEEGCMVE